MSLKFWSGFLFIWIHGRYITLPPWSATNGDRFMESIVPPRLTWTEKIPINKVQRILAQGYQRNVPETGSIIREPQVRLVPHLPIPLHDRLSSVFDSDHCVTLVWIFHDRGSISLEPIFRHCPHLQSLHIRGGQSLQILPPSAPLSPLPPRANMDDGATRHFERELFLNPFTMPMLTTLMLKTLYIHPLDVGDLAEAFLPTLQVLRLKDLHISPEYDPLTPSPKLTAAELRAYWYCTHRHRTLPEQYLDALLRHHFKSAKFRHLRQVQFTLRGASLLHRWHPLEMQRFFNSLEKTVREWVLGYTDMCNLWTADAAILSDGWCLMPEPWPPLAPIPSNLTSLDLVLNWEGGVDKDGLESLPDVGAMLHEFLCDAASLRHLKARLLKYNVFLDVFGAADVLGAHPKLGGARADGAKYRDTRLWACRDLETLHLGFHGEGLYLRLEGGFCLLSELMRLEVLKIECSVQHVDLKRCRPQRADLDWMAVEPVPRQAQKGSFRKMRSGDERDVTAAWVNRLTKESSMNHESKSHRDHEMLKYLGSLRDVKAVLETMGAKGDNPQKRPIWPYLYTTQVHRHSKKAEDKKTPQQIQWLRNIRA
ncbi:hypothetical protein BG006_005389 [Podila minutissima]|uniref:F-box domain-containing protein n=1 Tax=Podila minutissima TaxID=64525 RepID=A0A9P5SK22_9FUNG|nr:hypothetical protein BG006_005389 [Podila minutissima]